MIVDPDGPGAGRRHTFAKLSGRGCLPICLPIYGAGLVNTGQHSLDERLAFALLRQHGTRLGNTGRTLPITLSRWRHGFESRWGCKEMPGQGRSSERPFGFSSQFANHVPHHGLEKQHEGLHSAAGEAWELRVFLGEGPVTGRTRHANKSVCTGRREAQRMLAEMTASTPARAPRR